MLQNFLDTINKLKSFDFASEQDAIIRSHTDVLLDMQAEQFAKGKAYNGADITLNGFGYSPVTIQQKKLFGRGLGAVTSHVTLFMTGQLYKELFIKITSDKFSFSSTVPYFRDLMRRTQDVTGLTKENKTEFAYEYTLKDMKVVLLRKTGLKINVKNKVAV